MFQNQGESMANSEQKWREHDQKKWRKQVFGTSEEKKCPNDLKLNKEGL